MPAQNCRDLALIFIIVGVAQAYTVFNPICSTPSPENPANFVGSPDSRGTLDILWSSLFTIFACTWSVQHLNVPEQREDRDPGWRGNIRWMLKGILSKSKWMITTVIAPEFVFACAATGLSDAKDQQKSMRDFAKEDGVEWTLIHCMFADMGGFVIRPGTGIASATEELPSDIGMKGEPVLSHPTVNSARTENDTISADVNRDGSIEGSPTIQIRGRASSNKGEVSALESGLDSKQGESQRVYTITAVGTEAGKQPSASSDPNPYHLDGRQIIAIRSQRHLKKLPRITENEINDKSKGDSFTKAITVGQISWMIIQVCVRGARGLAIAQLEIAVIAFSFCAIFIYAMQWLRPKDVGVPITLIQYEGPIPPEVLVLLHKEKPERERWGKRISNDTPFWETGSGSDIAIVGLVLGCLVFGAPHIGAWNFQFPTEIEQTIWRVTSLYCTCFGILSFIMAVMAVVAMRMFPLVSEGVAGLLIGVPTGLYVVGRLFILVEIFRTLCFLPASGYVSTWTLNLPYVG
jgi:hypothetical protein